MVMEDELIRLRAENEKLKHLIFMALEAGDTDWYFGTDLAGQMREALGRDKKDSAYRTFSTSD